MGFFMPRGPIDRGPGLRSAAPWNESWAYVGLSECRPGMATSVDCRDQAPRVAEDGQPLGLTEVY